MPRPTLVGGLAASSLALSLSVIFIGVPDRYKALAGICVPEASGEGAAFGWGENTPVCRDR